MPSPKSRNLSGFRSGSFRQQANAKMRYLLAVEGVITRPIDRAAQLADIRNSGDTVSHEAEESQTLFTAEDVEEIKRLALEQIASEGLDTPEGHLAYIRKQIKAAMAPNV